METGWMKEDSGNRRNGGTLKRIGQRDKNEAGKTSSTSIFQATWMGVGKDILVSCGQNLRPVFYDFLRSQQSSIASFRTMAASDLSAVFSFLVSLEGGERSSAQPLSSSRRRTSSPWNSRSWAIPSPLCRLS